MFKNSAFLFGSFFLIFLNTVTQTEVEVDPMDYTGLNIVVNDLLTLLQLWEMEEDYKELISKTFAKSR